MRRWGKRSRNRPDSPRYRAMGNGTATIALEVMGNRVEACDALRYDEIGAV